MWEMLRPQGTAPSPSSHIFQWQCLKEGQDQSSNGGLPIVEGRGIGWSPLWSKVNNRAATEESDRIVCPERNMVKHPGALGTSEKQRPLQSRDTNTYIKVHM